MKKYILYFLFVNLFAIDVSVSILPQKFIVDNISANKINVNVMIPKGASPVTYSPSIKQLMKLKKSDVYFSIGVPFEKAWIKKFISINPKIKVVNFAKYIKKDSNPHIWLDPILLISQAKVVEETLSEIDPQNKKIYLSNFLKFKKECLKIDNKLTELLKNLTNRKFMIFHPNLYYFAKRYSLQEIAIEKNAKEASMKYLIYIINLARQNNIKVIFTSPEFSQKSANFIAQKIGAKVIGFSALEYNIFNNLLKVGQILNVKN